MHEQVNKHVYLADMREKYYAEVSTCLLAVLKKAGTGAKAMFAKEIKKFEEVQAQKKAVESDIKLKQELHIKSVMFERDNL